MDRRTGVGAIAEAAGVSTTAVYHALRDTGTISEATRTRIKNLAEELGYVPNRLAGGLRTGKSTTVGAIFRGRISGFFGTVLSDLERELAAGGYALFLRLCERSPEDERRATETILERAPEGIVLVGSFSRENEGLWRRLAQARLPVVAAEAPGVGRAVDAVSFDNTAGGYLVGTHLADLGRSRVWCVMTRIRGRVQPTLQARLRGCSQALAERGLPQARELKAELTEEMLWEQASYRCLRRALDAGEHPDAVFAGNDMLATGALRALFEAGLQVPQDVSVVGYDDSRASAYAQPALTTVSHRPERLGTLAAHLLLERLAGQAGDGQPRHILLEPQLVVRESCGAALGSTHHT